jgi:hypothetical protein
MGSTENKKMIRSMKANGFHFINISLLFLCFCFSQLAYSQTNPPTPTCVICGGKNGVHATTCRYYNPPAGINTKTQSKAMPDQVQQLNMLIDLFNSPDNTKEAEAEKEAARKAAIEAKAREDNLRKVRHEEVMKTFKSLDGPNDVRPAEKPVSDISFKPLPSASAPMTREERERQTLIGNKAKITWNYNEFSNISTDNQIPEAVPQPEPTGNEKLINDMIAKVESNGGRMAAITGRYILNVKDGVMNYLDDATYAVTSGNSYIMQETGEFDVKKITVNALYKTANQTAKIYYENARDEVTGGLKDAGIGVLKNAGINMMQSYKYFDNLSVAWRQIR